MRWSSRLLMAFSSLTMLVGSAMHTSAYMKVVPLIDRSGLPSQYAAIYKGLWLSDSTTVFILGLIFGAAALFPRFAARPIIILVALIPIGSAATIYATIGSFSPAHILLGSGVVVLIAQFLPGQNSKRREQMIAEV